MTRALGALLLLGGTMALTWSGVTWATGLYERLARGQAIPPIVAAHDPVRGDTVGVLQIPRLGLSVVVVEGDDASSLMLGAGHLQDTPMPWEPGNSVIAGHRDTDFAPLEHVRRGDILAFKTGNATVEYVVSQTSVVEPSEVSVLRSGNTDELTLITCYPFGFIGPAPSRFVVRASRTHIVPRDITSADLLMKTGTPPAAPRVR